MALASQERKVVVLYLVLGLTALWLLIEAAPGVLERLQSLFGG